MYLLEIGNEKHLYSSEYLAVEQVLILNLQYFQEFQENFSGEVVFNDEHQFFHNYDDAWPYMVTFHPKLKDGSIIEMRDNFPNELTYNPQYPQESMLFFKATKTMPCQLDLGSTNWLTSNSEKIQELQVYAPQFVDYYHNITSELILKIQKELDNGNVGIENLNSLLAYIDSEFKSFVCDYIIRYTNVKITNLSMDEGIKYTSFRIKQTS